MKIIKPSVEILSVVSGDLLAEIEVAARNCYKSEDKITLDSGKKMISSLIKNEHTAMLEFADITVRILTDRGVMAELTRHRHLSFAIESTRYCKYNKDKFGSQLTFIEPCFWVDEPNEMDVLKAQKMGMWEIAMRNAENAYLEMMEVGATAQEARSVLPNSLKTEIVCKGNVREWRHVLKLRCDKAAHPQIREVMCMLLKELHSRVPVLFDDLYMEFIIIGGN